MDLKISVEMFHDIAKTAATNMYKIGDCFEFDPSEYGESDFSHHLGVEFIKENCWVGFEARYPFDLTDPKPPKYRADLKIYSNGGTSTLDQYMWIEVKSTGRKRYESFQYSSALNWEKDFAHLRELTSPRWGGSHYPFWTWLYLTHELVNNHEARRVG